jgi:transposase
MRQQKRYSPEYRAEAVKLVLEQGKSIAGAARQLGMSKSSLQCWVMSAKGLRASGSGVAPGSRTVHELEAELSKLRKELSNTQMERDILKKATAYFARESMLGTPK